MKREIISKIVKASGVSAGELVLVHFWGEDAEKEIANSFMAPVAALGATPVFLQQARMINMEIFLSAKESCFDDRYFDFFQNLPPVQIICLAVRIRHLTMLILSDSVKLRF